MRKPASQKARPVSQKTRWSKGPVVRRPDSQKARLWESPLVERPVIQKACQSQGPLVIRPDQLVRRPVSQKTRQSKGPVVRRSVSPKALQSEETNNRESHTKYFINFYSDSNLFNPLSPHDALKHHLASLKNDLISWNLAVLERTFSWNSFKNNSIFFSFFIHFKSSSSTTSRELLQQFTARSVWRRQW